MIAELRVIEWDACAQASKTIQNDSMIEIVKMNATLPDLRLAFVIFDSSSLHGIESPSERLLMRGPNLRSEYREKSDKCQTRNGESSFVPSPDSIVYSLAPRELRLDRRTQFE